MAKPKGTLSKKVIKKVEEYFKKNDIKPNKEGARTDSAKPQAD